MDGTHCRDSHTSIVNYWERAKLLYEPDVEVRAPIYRPTQVDLVAETRPKFLVNHSAGAAWILWIPRDL